MRHEGSSFPYQGWNLPSHIGRQSLSQCTAREALTFTLFLVSGLCVGVYPLYCQHFLGEVEAAVSVWIAQLLEKLRFIRSVWCPAQMFRYQRRV